MSSKEYWIESNEAGLTSCAGRQLLSVLLVLLANAVNPVDRVPICRVRRWGECFCRFGP